MFRLDNESINEVNKIAREYILERNINLNSVLD